MSRFRSEHDELEHLSPRPRLLATILRLAPELAAIAVLDDALRTALVALLAEHPTLDDHHGVLEPPTLRRARRLARDAFHLRDTLDAYRDAVLGAVGASTSPDDDIPF